MPQPITSLLGDIVTQHAVDIEAWFDAHYSNVPPFLYASVDLRHSGHKLAPVDTNLFPAGFNLLSDKALTQASAMAAQYFADYLPEMWKNPERNVLLIPENHTRNRYYLDNIAALSQLLKASGCHVLLGGLQIAEPTTLESATRGPLTIHPVTKDGAYLQSQGIVADCVVINNDLTSGAPEILHDVKQPIFPPIGMGWYQRRKTQHFDSYKRVADDFSAQFGLDSWLISTQFHKCGAINFREKNGLECVALGVERVLHQIRRKYDEYGIIDTPYVFIKSNLGTYGMGIMTVTDPEQVYEINKKTRHKMQQVKEGADNTEVIIQEGVPTIDRIDDRVAEPLIYLIGGKTAGHTYRINENRDAFGNLNSQGMRFSNACDDDHEAEGGKTQSLCPVQSLIARLAALAATKECYEDDWVI